MTLKVQETYKRVYFGHVHCCTIRCSVLLFSTMDFQAYLKTEIPSQSIAQVNREVQDVGAAH